MTRVLAIVFGIFAGVTLMAQQDSIIVITDVVVMENRIKVPLSRKPAAIAVIDSAIINNSPGISIADILHNIAGVDMRQRGINGIQTDAGIRGSSFDQVLVLVNGVRMNDSQTGHHNFNLPVDPEIIDRIEIFKGPSARVFGQNAFAGAINIITRNPDYNFLSIGSYSGSFRLLGGSALASLNTRTTKNRISVSSSRSDGYRYNTDYSLTNLLYQGEVLTGSGVISYMAGLSDRNFGANGFYSGPSFTDQYEEITTSIASITYEPALTSPSAEMTTRIYWRRNNDNYILKRYEPDYYHNNHLTNTIGADINITLFSSAGITGTGLELTSSAINSTRLGNHNRAGISLFAEHRMTLFGERLSITPGFQLNHSTGFGTSLLPGVDIGLTVSDKMLLFINSGYTYRVPTFTDLYYQDPGNLSNPLLKPEYALSHEVGLKTTRVTAIHAQASFFSRRGFNLIDRVKENETDKWLPVNIRETVFNGFETSITILPRKLTSFNSFPVTRLSAGYLFTSANIDGTTNGFSRFALENLRNQLLLSTDVSYGQRITHTITARYTDRVNSDAYITADTRISLTVSNLNIFAEISNLGGTEYYETWQVTMPGRWFRIGVSLKHTL